MARQIKSGTKQKKASARRAQAKKTEEAQPLIVKIALEPTDDIPLYYINHIEISHTRHDFSLSCAHVPTTFPTKVIDEAKHSGVITLQPLIRLIVPPTLIAGIIKALQAQKSKYEDSFGKIKDEIQGGK